MLGRVPCRMSSSSIIRESRDLGAGFFDTASDTLCESEATPMHIGSIPGYLRGIQETLEDGEWYEGDVVVHNHPYYGSSHTPDLAIVVPDIYARGCSSRGPSSTPRASPTTPCGTTSAATRAALRRASGEIRRGGGLRRREPAHGLCRARDAGAHQGEPGRRPCRRGLARRRAEPRQAAHGQGPGRQGRGGPHRLGRPAPPRPTTCPSRARPRSRPKRASAGSCSTPRPPRRRCPRTRGPSARSR